MSEATTFYTDEDGEDTAYRGQFRKQKNDALSFGNIGVVTPYFEDKLECETYTRRLCEANEVPYDYDKNIWSHRGTLRNRNN